MKVLSQINWISILKALGILLLFEGMFMLLCIPFSLYYDGVDTHAILLSAAITLISGVLFSIPGKVKKMKVTTKDAYIIVTISWIFISLFGTLPYMLSGEIPIFANAFFESISGFTTTGASILTDIESVSKGILFWRSMTHWIGGIGIIVLFTAIMPLLGSSSMQLFSVETSAVTIEKLHPQIKGTAIRLSMVYFLLTAMETILLMIGKMNLFDALCHSFGTIATGGFSTQNASVANYSPYIQYVIIIFMVLAGINFTIHYYSLTGRFSKVKKSNELRFYLALVVIASLVVTASLLISNTQNLPIEQAFRDASFQVVSIITCTGFVTADYTLWPTISWFILFLLMFSGGMAGSTTGGIKTYRHLLLLRLSRTELHRRLHPNAIMPVRYNNAIVSEAILTNVQAFIIIYMLTFLVGTLGMILFGLDAKSAAGGVASCLGGIGPGLGSVGPVSNYALITTPGKYFLSLIMLLGRLELYTLLILFTRTFWRK